MLKALRAKVAVLYDPWGWNSRVTLIECGSEAEIGIHNKAPHGIVSMKDFEENEFGKVDSMLKDASEKKE